MQGSKKSKGQRGSGVKDVQGSKKLRRSERLRCQKGAGVKTFSGQIGSGVIEAQESESFVSQRVSGVRFVLESQRFKGQRRSGSESFESHIGSGVRSVP